MIRNHFPMTLNKIYLMNVNMMLNIKEEWNRTFLTPRKNPNLFISFRKIQGAL